MSKNFSLSFLFQLLSYSVWSSEEIRDLQGGMALDSVTSSFLLNFSSICLSLHWTQVSNLLVSFSCIFFRHHSDIHCYPFFESNELFLCVFFEPLISLIMFMCFFEPVSLGPSGYSFSLEDNSVSLLDSRVGIRFWLFILFVLLSLCVWHVRVWVASGWASAAGL